MLGLDPLDRHLSPAARRRTEVDHTLTGPKEAELLIQFVHNKQAFGDKVEEVAAERMSIVQRPWIEAGHRAMFAPEMLSFSPEDLARMDVPALVVHGRQDVIVPIESSRYLAEHLPQADLFVINECGHWTQIEQADKFAGLLRTFVEGGLS